MGLPTTEDHIVSAERQGHFELPRPWRNMLLRSNGFEVEANRDEWSAFPVLDASSRRHVTRSANHILRETETIRSARGFPAKAVAIAGNVFGDMLVLLPQSSDVFVWHHETGELDLAQVSYPEMKSDFEDPHG